MKEMKNITKKNFEKITKYAKVHSTDIVVTFVLDSMTKFLTGDSKATFIGQGAPFYTSAEDLQLSIRKADHGALEKEVIEVMMQRMCGGQNSDGGDITQEMSAEKNVKIYLDFFPYFKTLSKMCHLAMTVKKELNTHKKITNNEATVKSYELQMKTAKHVADVLKCFEQIKEASDRIKFGEISILQEKEAKVNERHSQITSKLQSFDRDWSVPQ